MSDLLAYLLAAAITLPIPMTIIVYMLTRKISRSKRMSLHVTVNSMTLLYILSVNATMGAIFDQSFFWYILIFLLVLLGMFVFLQWKYKDEIHFTKAWRGFWRFSFVLFAFAYIGLTLFGLTDRLLAL
ncbi:DUF3397 domain-containing protein [Pontibacillus marinus]|uniref:DUF3397 domain-containing protein n=1 Tax=Pontibacillus marinus BH030004 = DSM 16465 TaxID=1385511 RepID=A0A0A5FV18_9BACI|nr:DUF3397 domain-containing protein [Pontibacillus marinus]KGX83764.1 hypothetical protein N783_21780 [Pontibacillus marinus BH030004 = DSM 16465]